MEEWINRSKQASCAVCHGHIEDGEPCVKLQTIYFCNGSRSSYLHYKCIDQAIQTLTTLKANLTTKYLVWRLKCTR